MGDGAESTIGIPLFRQVSQSTVYRSCLGCDRGQSLEIWGVCVVFAGAIAQKTVESLMFFVVI